MADPARKIDYSASNDPRATETPVGTTPDPRISTHDPVIDNRKIVEGRGAGNGAIVAAIVVVLAVIAYFVFAPGTSETPAPSDPATTTTEPAPATPPATAPDATAPDATAPAAPTDPAQPAPSDSTTTTPEQPAEPALTAPQPAPAQ